MIRKEKIFDSTPLVCAVIAYLTAGFFNDSNVGTAQVFWILLGLSLASIKMETRKR